MLSVLDVGASKIVCLIARLTPMEPSEALRGRTHRCKVLGIGHQRSSGVKGGAVVDLEAAEHAARLAIDAAERMAGVEVGGVIVNMSGGRLASRRHGADAPLIGKTVAEHDIHRVLEAAAAANAEPGRTILHALPTGFRLDATKDVRDPKGMVGERTWRRSSSRHLRFGGRAQPDAGHRALPFAGRGDGGDALRRRPFDAGRRRGRARRGGGRFRRRLDDGRRVLRRAAHPCRRGRPRRHPCDAGTSRAGSTFRSATPNA